MSDKIGLFTDMAELWRLDPAAARLAEACGAQHDVGPPPDRIVICVRCDARHPLLMPDNALGGCDRCGSQVQFRPMWIGRPNPRRCIECAVPELGPVLLRQLYRNDAYPERACDRCETLYRGPAVYCSFECAVADA